MSHDRQTEPKRTGPQAEPTLAEPVATDATTFTATGQIPPVEGEAKPGPTASELAFGPEKGPGAKALEALLAKGTPEAKIIVDLIDAHRAEHDAMLALVEQKLGAAYLAEVRDAMGLRASVKRREVVAGDPSDPDSGYFIASQAEKGARWRTGDGRFSGKADDKGLDSTYRLDDDDALHAHVGKDKTGTLAWERDGKNQGELYGRYGGSGDYEGGVRRSWDVGDGQLTTGLRHRVQDGEGTQSVFGGYRTADGKTSGEVAVGMHEGHLAESASLTTKPTAHDTISGEIAHDDRGTTGKLAATHGWEGGQLDGSVTRSTDSTALHLGAREQVSPQLSLSGHLDHVEPDDGKRQTTIGLSERYRSPGVVQSLDVEAGKGERDYAQTQGSIDARLGGQLYGGAWGMYKVEEGHQQSSQLGASLTLTPSEKTALTLAGVLDHSGALEARLQFDVFKSRIRSVSDLADHKKDALLSLFISYSTDGNKHMFDDRLGKPQLGTPDGQQVRAGVRIKF